MKKTALRRPDSETDPRQRGSADEPAPRPRTDRRPAAESPEAAPTWTEITDEPEPAPAPEPDPPDAGEAGRSTVRRRPAGASTPRSHAPRRDTGTRPGASTARRRPAGGSAPRSHPDRYYAVTKPRESAPEHRLDLRMVGAVAAALLICLGALALAALISSADDSDEDLEGKVTRAPEATTPTSVAPPTTARPTTPAAPGATEALADTPEGLADQLVRAEGTIHDDNTSPEALGAAARLQQRVYRVLGAHPEWDDEVYDRVPDGLTTTVERNLHARRQFRSMTTKVSDYLPAWRIIAPASAEQLLAYYREAEDTFDVPWQYLAAINLVETGMGRIQGDSVAGAQGPMQFMPKTWEAYGEGGDVLDPRDAIMAAARYLAANGGATGDIDDALWNYNHHPAYVAGVKAYADEMEDDQRAFLAYHQWDVIYKSSAGDVVLSQGYAASEPVLATDYLASHPDSDLP